MIHGPHLGKDDEPIQEIKILMETNHENIIEYVGYFIEDRQICIITHYYKVKRHYRNKHYYI